MTDNHLNAVLLALGKAQVDAMFRRQEAHAIDDSEFAHLRKKMEKARPVAKIGKKSRLSERPS